MLFVGKKIISLSDEFEPEEADGNCCENGVMELQPCLGYTTKSRSEVQLVEEESNSLTRVRASVLTEVDTFLIFVFSRGIFYGFPKAWEKETEKDNIWISKKTVTEKDDLYSKEPFFFFLLFSNARK